MADPTPEQLQRWFTQPVARRLGLYRIPPELRLSVVIPVYNEVASVEEIVRRVREVPIAKEIIVVDDGSTDGTRDRLASMEGQPDLKIVYHPHNQGKGAAVRTGFEHATGDIVLVQDADLEYDPIQYPLLIQPIVEGVADVVYGSRFAAGAPHRVLYFWHSVANRFLTTFSNAVTDLNLTDMETCYKVFRRDVIAEITPTLKEKGFGIEVELTAKVARRKCRIYEIGISYFGRTYKEGKKIKMRDAFHALWCIVRYAFAD
jgi:glycosyltransferase involved in cell wall biosynthesis